MLDGCPIFESASIPHSAADHHPDLDLTVNRRTAAILALSDRELGHPQYDVSPGSGRGTEAASLKGGVKLIQALSLNPRLAMHKVAPRGSAPLHSDDRLGD